MSQIVYVDLSAKVEQWTVNSGIAMASTAENGVSKTLLIHASVKQQARDRIMAKHGRKSVRYRLLAILVYLSVKDNLKEIRQIVIDKDYAGEEAESTIKNVLLHLLRSQKADIPAGFIQFNNVKGSEADERARQVFRGKEKPSRVIGWAELKALLNK